MGDEFTASPSKMAELAGTVLRTSDRVQDQNLYSGERQFDPGQLDATDGCRQLVAATNAAAETCGDVLAMFAGTLENDADGLYQAASFYHAYDQDAAATLKAVGR